MWLQPTDNIYLDKNPLWKGRDLIYYRIDKTNGPYL